MLFSSKDLIQFKDAENPHVDLVFYRAPLELALERLKKFRAAMAASRYFSGYFSCLHELEVRLGEETHPYIEVEFDELLFAGQGRFPKRIPKAGRVMEDLGSALTANRFGQSRRLLNYFGPICGMKLLGFRWLDHIWWWLDRKLTGISTDTELCRWWAIGVLEARGDRPSAAATTLIPE